MKKASMTGSDQWGLHNEERSHKALKKKTKLTPKWFVDFQLVTDEFDVMGVDGRAKIKKRGHWKPMSVPVQIKSSEAGKEEYYRRHPDAKAVGVVVLVVLHDMTPDQIRAMAYKALEVVYRSYDRNHFKKYFDSLGRREKSARQHRNFQRIKEKRTVKDEQRSKKPKRPVKKRKR